MITLIAAMNPHRTIGLDGIMPWHKPEDLTHFKNYTMHKKLFMGRKTYEGLPKKLKGRDIYVFTRDETYPQAISNVHDFFKQHQNSDEEIIVAGGGEIYHTALPYTNKIVLSLIEDNDVVGDTFFPHINEDEFTLDETIQHETFKLLIYNRKKV